VTEPIWNQLLVLPLLDWYRESGLGAAEQARRQGEWGMRGEISP